MTNVISQTIPLDLLTVGEHGVVVAIEGRTDLVNRLEEMGLHSGARIRMIRPGSPCILEINHHRYSIRFEDSAMVLVDVSK